MIIAIAGSIGSGKDTVGRIIQYLFWKKRVETENLTFHYSLKDFLNNNPLSDVLSNWEINKFADTLKDIVCLLTGCKRADLENEDFKNQELSEEWDMYELSWSDGWDGRKNIVCKDFDKNDYLDKKGQFYGSLSKPIKMTYRKLLQLLGTEAGRSVIHPNIWINSLMQDYKEVFYQYKGDEWNQGYSAFPNWIITDLRFPNEYKAVKDRKGLCIKVTRTYENIPDIYAHSSETSLNNHEFDHIIENNGTIDDLVVKVEEFLTKFNLLD